MRDTITLAAGDAGRSNQQRVRRPQITYDIGQPPAASPFAPGGATPAAAPGCTNGGATWSFGCCPGVVGTPLSTNAPDWRNDPYDSANRCLRFEVSDSGPGIDKDLIPSLFEPYSRFGELTRSGDGAGLGLAIVSSVLRFLGGSVSVSSEPGKGTTFLVAIPAELLEDEHAKPGRRTGSSMTGRKCSRASSALSSSWASNATRP
jgi:hypothetical protein